MKQRFLLGAFCRHGGLLALIFSFVVSSSLGCGERGRTGGPTEIVYWTGWSGHELDVQQSLIDEFNRTHPQIHVRMLSQFGASGYQKVRIAFAGGATPDVMSTVWADELASYALRGVLTPLDESLRASGRDVDREYAPGIAHMLQVDGHVYGLAVTNDVTFVAYNRKLFRDAGLDPNRPPQTLAALDAAAETCTQHDPQGGFVRYGFHPSNLILWAYVFGGSWYDPVSHRITANCPQNIAALQWMASYAKKYDMKRIASFESTFGSNETPSGPFYVGKVAMEVTGEWEQAFVKRYAPTLDWGWFALPAPPGGRPNTTTAGGSVFVIPAACQHKEAAWEFLNWISSPHAVKSFCWQINNLPPLISVCQDPLFKNDPLYRSIIPIANGPNSFGPPPIAIWPTYGQEITRAEDAVVLGGEDPQRVLDGLQIKMEAEMARTTQDLSQ